MARFLHDTLIGFWPRIRNKGVPQFTVAFLLVCLAGFLVGCEDVEEEKPWIYVDRPQMLFTDTTLLDSYNEDVLSWKLKTAYLERWDDKQIVFVRPIFVDIYDSVGERAAFLRADSGSFDMKFSYVNAYGHVYAITPKGASVRADSLIWNKRDNIVRTESYVRVVSEDGDVLQGKGFESDAKMDNWKILANVTGIFQDAANRLKEEDKKQVVEIEKADSASAVSSSSVVASSSAVLVPASGTSVTPVVKSSASAVPVQSSAQSSVPAPAQTPVQMLVASSASNSSASSGASKENTSK